MRTVVIGLGNEILSDDAVGIHAARLIRAQAPDGVCVTEVHAGGLRLMDAMVGFDRAVIIDAMESGGCPPGTISEIALSDIHATRNITSTHDTSLKTALEMGRLLGLELPTDISIWGIEARDTETFSEQLSAEVHDAMGRVVTRVLGDVRGEGGLS